MGKRRRKKFSSSLTWKATRGFFRLLFQGILKVAPLVLIGGIGVAIFWSLRRELHADPGFLLESLEILPEKALAPSLVQELEGIYRGQNLFKISLREVSERVEKNPWIGEARVIRKFPRVLRIEIRERKPAASVRLSHYGPSYTVSEEGVLLERNSAAYQVLLLVEAFPFGDIRGELGKDFPLPGLKEGLALAQSFHHHALAQSEMLEKIRLDSGGNVSLILAEGPELRFGPNPMKRFFMLNRVVPLLKGPDRKRILYIDLQYKDLIVKKR